MILEKISVTSKICTKHLLIFYIYVYPLFPPMVINYTNKIYFICVSNCCCYFWGMFHKVSLVDKNVGLLTLS